MHFVCQPAHIAGCKTVVLATPPSHDGSICKVFVLSICLVLMKFLGGDPC